MMPSRFAIGAALFLAVAVCALLVFWLFFSKEDYSRYRLPDGSWRFPPGTPQSVLDGAAEWERKQRGPIDDSLRREFLLKRSREDSAKRSNDSAHAAFDALSPKERKERHAKFKLEIEELLENLRKISASNNDKHRIHFERMTNDPIYADSFRSSVRRYSDSLRKRADFLLKSGAYKNTSVRIIHNKNKSFISNDSAYILHRIYGNGKYSKGENGDTYIDFSNK